MPGCDSAGTHPGRGVTLEAAWWRHQDGWKKGGKAFWTWTENTWGKFVPPLAFTPWQWEVFGWGRR